MGWAAGGFRVLVVVLVVGGELRWFVGSYLRMCGYGVGAQLFFLFVVRHRAYIHVTSESL